MCCSGETSLRGESRPLESLQPVFFFFSINKKSLHNSAFPFELLYSYQLVSEKFDRKQWLRRRWQVGKDSVDE